VDIDGKAKTKSKGDVDIDVKGFHLPKFGMGGKTKGDVDGKTKTPKVKGDVEGKAKGDINANVKASKSKGDVLTLIFPSYNMISV